MPLETAGMKPLYCYESVGSIVVGTNLISTLYCSIMMCTNMVIFCNKLCMQYWNMEMFAILILQALILQGGNNTEILPNPSVG